MSINPAKGFIDIVDDLSLPLAKQQKTASKKPIDILFGIQCGLLAALMLFRKLRDV